MADEARRQLDEYFERIGYRGPASASLETLGAIHLRHALSIPFENLNPLLRLPVPLDIASLQQKLLRDGRGGYCFEHNLLLSHTLKLLGFSIRGLAARVLWNRPEGMATPRSHMLLLVEAEGERFIADVGFGGMVLSAPLRLVPDVEQQTPHEPFRLLAQGTAEGDEFILQALVRGSWRPVYRFGLHEQLLPDYEVTNWYLSNCPSSHFRTGLSAARPGEQVRYALRDNALATHHLNGPTERRELQSVAEIKAVLTETFGLTLPKTPALDTALERIVQAQPLQSAVG